jgi:hypothetical protein
VGNACYHGIQNLLSSHLLSKKTRNLILKNLFFVIYVCETWPQALMEEHILRVCKNRVLRRISGCVESTNRRL